MRNCGKRPLVVWWQFIFNVPKVNKKSKLCDITWEMGFHRNMKFCHVSKSWNLTTSLNRITTFKLHSISILLWSQGPINHNIVKIGRLKKPRPISVYLYVKQSILFCMISVNKTCLCKKTPSQKAWLWEI